MIKSYSFNINAPASSSLTQTTSGQLDFKHRIIRLKALFSSGMQDSLKIYFFGGVNTSDTDGTTSTPLGFNLLAQPGLPTSGTSLAVPYLQSAGGPVLVNIDTMTDIKSTSSFLAVRVENSSASALRVQCWIEVQELQD